MKNNKQTLKCKENNAILLLDPFPTLEISTAYLGGRRGKYLNRYMDNVFVVLPFKLFVLMPKYFLL